MITLIDNYDSFTYNVYHAISKNGFKVNVIKNEKLIKNYQKIIDSKAVIISPGPSNPYNAGECLNLIDRIYSFMPILGICLGHQIIAAFFKNNIKKLKKPVHGKLSEIITIRKNKLFNNMPQKFLATRYHSLYVDKKKLTKDLSISCISNDDNIVMGLKHKLYNIHGVQFHPESIETINGEQIIENFLKTV